MIITYRPELENPPMDKECSIGFSFIGENGAKAHVRCNSGVTRGFSSAVWDRIKDYDVVHNLLALGALVAQDDEPEVCEAPAPKQEEESIVGMGLHAAMTLVEASFDMDQLRKWDAKDNRIKVKNAIARRIAAITEGNG